MPCKVRAAELGRFAALPKLQCCAMHKGCVFWRPLYGLSGAWLLPASMHQRAFCCKQTHHLNLTSQLVTLCNQCSGSCRHIGGQQAEHARSQAGSGPGSEAPCGRRA